MRRLWVAAALAPLTFAASTVLAAPTQVAGGTTPVNTATVGPGATANDIEVTGTISPTTANTAAVTIGSNNSVTVDAGGGISFLTLNNVVGIQANPGFTGLIQNLGTISLTETTTGTSTNQGIVNGPFANGSGRYGIYLAPVGTFTGLTTDTNNPGRTTAIDTTGAISVIGENSAGVYTAGNVVGDILLGGAINVVGGNPTNDATPSPTVVLGNSGDVSYGVHTQGTVAGNVSITGTVSATGQNAVGVALDQGATGAVKIANTVAATGYRSTTNPGLTLAPLLDSDQTLMGGPAVYIGGNNTTITGGVQVSAAAAATSSTAAVAGGSVISFGKAPALLIGGQGPLILNQVGTSGADLLIAGSVSGLGVYDDVNATALQIGGANPLPVSIGGVGPGVNFGTVTLSDGLSVTGTIGAATLAETGTKGTSTAIDIGQGATVQSINVSGTVSASSAADTASNPTVTALKIESGSTVASVVNSGAIQAVITPTTGLVGNVTNYVGGLTGSPTAIQVSSATPISVTNTNKITAGFLNAPTAAISPNGVNSRGTAIDFSGSLGAATVTQSPFTGTLPAGVTSITPAITGDILFGSGAGALNIQTGTVTGNLQFGNNLGNSLTIASGSTVTGDLAQTNGGSLALTINGALTMNAPTSAALAAVAGTSTSGPGTTGGAAAPITLTSLNLGSSGQLGFTINPNDAAETALGFSQFKVNGATALASGAKVNINLTSILTNTDTYTLIQNINGTSFTSGGLNTALIGSVPFIDLATINTVQGANGSLSLTLAPKTAAQMTGFSVAERAEYNAFLAAFPQDSNLLADILSKTTAGDFKKAYDQFLPDFSGGPYQSLELGQEAIYRAQADVPAKMPTDQSRGWVQEIGFLDHRNNNDSGGYDGGGFGVVGGLESPTGDGAVGMSAAFLTSAVRDAGQSNNGHLSGSAVEAGVYWRSGGSGLNFDASVNAGWAWFDSKRLFLDVSAPDPVSGASTSVVKTAQSSWSGGLVAAHLGVKYPMTMGRFYMRPEGSVDYYALFEGAHAEHGGGTGFNLNVKSRTSQEALAQADMVFGVNLGQTIKWRPELTVGWRGVIEGGPGSTTANFSGGQAFTLSAPQDKGGLLARLGVRAGGAFADFAADAGGVYGNGSQNYDARAVARFLF